MAELKARGFLGGNVERRGGSSHADFGSFRLADRKSFFDKEKQQWVTLKEQWLDCTVSGADLGWYENRLVKGAEVTVFGEFYVRHYEGKNGPGTALSVQVHAIQFHPPRNKSGRSQGAQDARSEDSGGWGTQSTGGAESSRGWGDQSAPSVDDQVSAYEELGGWGR